MPELTPKEQYRKDLQAYAHVIQDSGRAAAAEAFSKLTARYAALEDAHEELQAEHAATEAELLTVKAQLAQLQATSAPAAQPPTSPAPDASTHTS